MTVAVQLDQMFLSSPPWWQPRTSTHHHTKGSPSSLLNITGLSPPPLPRPLLIPATSFKSTCSFHLYCLLHSPHSPLFLTFLSALTFFPSNVVLYGHQSLQLLRSSSPSSGAFKPGKQWYIWYIVSIWYIGLLLRLFSGEKKERVSLLQHFWKVLAWKINFKPLAFHSKPLSPNSPSEALHFSKCAYIRITWSLLFTHTVTFIKPHYTWDQVQTT